MGQLTINQIEKLLPHRYPFLLIDRILSYKAKEEIVALKNVTMNEPYFSGHFPSKPIMPGVLIIEAMAQTAALLGCLSVDEQLIDATYYLVGVDNVRFKRPVEPGDQLILSAFFEKERRDIWKFRTNAMVEENLVASAEILTTAKEIVS